MIIYILSSITTGSVAVVFFFIGKISERRDWNKLIEDGVIPKPKNK